MGADYYSILGVPKTATDAEIATAYKKKALRCHPDKLRFKPGMSEAEKTKLKNKTEEEFKQVAQAYQVLSDKEKRPIYDKYGEEGLNGAMGQGFGGGSQTFYTNVDPRTVFESFFKGSSFGFNMDGEDNGHTMSFVTNGSGPESIFSSFGMGNMGGGHNFIGSQCGGGSARRGHRQQPQQMEQDPPVMYDLGVTLEELMTGTNKKMKITITDYNTNQKTASEFDIAIQKSWKEGTKITYEKMGDKHPGRIPADIIFVLKDKPHPHFKRDKDNNLIYTCNISLKDALIGCRVNVPLLGEVGTITKSVPGVIKPTSSFVIEGKGLPLKKNDNRRANLIVKFDITFPSSLTPQEAEIIRNLRSM